MQLFVTQHGIARRSAADADQLEVVDPNGHDLLPVIRSGILADLADVSGHYRFPLAEASFRPPIARPGRFMIVGLNYRSHCEETGKPIPERLVFAIAPGTAAGAADGPIVLPNKAPSCVAYEGELAVIIGRPAESVRAEDAWEFVAGIAPLNDVSAKDVQATGTRDAVAEAKGFPTFKPFGPCVATIDEFADPLGIGLRTFVNGELRQAGRTSDMVFDIPAIIEAISARTILRAGDVICTGTPGGVPHPNGFPYLQAGDHVEIELEGLPRLSNPVVAEV